MNKVLGCLFLIFSLSLHAHESITYHGTDDIRVPITQASGQVSSIDIVLPHIEYSKEALHWFQQQARNRHTLIHAPIEYPELPRFVNVGMQGTPVLNQGRHGSCVAFAVTGALDALIGAGDYISQLCHLELGSQLAIDGVIKSSGWAGSEGHWVLKQITDYGIVSKQVQKAQGCAGVHEYPTHEKQSQGHPMSPAEFSEHSVDLGKLFSWSSILSSTTAHSQNVDMEEMLHRVKTELAHGNRVTIGTGLDSGRGHHGAFGQFHVKNDSWMLTPEIVMDALNNNIHSGHHMIVIGYDDDAVTVDDDGYLTNQGLFTLRNSWSGMSGDQGNYYMSYDYFRFLVHNLNIVSLKAHA